MPNSMSDPMASTAGAATGIPPFSITSNPISGSDQQVNFASDFIVGGGSKNSGMMMYIVLGAIALTAFILLRKK